MSEVAKTLTERRNRVWEQAKALADKAAEENRQFTGEEDGTWTTLNAELDALDKRISAVLEGEKRAQDAENKMSALDRDNKRGTGSGTPSGPGNPSTEELRAFLRGEGPRSLVIKPTGEFRDLLSTTGAAGGNTVPTGFYGRLVEHMIEVSAILQSGATILNTASGEPLPIPKTTAHGSAGIVAQGAPIPENDPAFGQIELNSFKYGDLIQIGRELLDDTGVDLEGYLARQAGRALGNAYGAHAVTGTGTGQPRGVVTDATVGVTGAATAGMATGFGAQATADRGADVLINLFHSVIAPYRRSPGCHWMMNDTTAAKVRKIKTADGDYVWQPSVVAGQPDLLLAKPVLIDPNVAAPAANAKSLVFGDFTQYFIRIAGGVRFERSDDYAFGNDLVTFRALMRADSALVDLTGAVKVFQHAAAD